MTTQTLSQKHARRLALEAQALLKPNPFGKGKKAVQKAIHQLSYVQIDTISVIERAHLHVLRTRVSNFQPKMLDQLVSKDRTTFEYWSHAAAYLPMEDYRYSLPRKQSIKNGEKLTFCTIMQLRKAALYRSFLSVLNTSHSRRGEKSPK